MCDLPRSLLWVGKGACDGSLRAGENHYVTEGNGDCCVYLRFNLIFQDFDREMAKGLRQAKALQGGRPGEESQVYGVRGEIIRLLYQYTKLSILGA